MINGLGKNQVIGSTLIERNQRLSQSRLWHLHSEFYKQSGVSAWTQGLVPHYITNNPYIANAYVRLAQSFLSALNLQDASQPVYIMELGAGSGRFAHHFLKLFHAAIEKTPLASHRIIYVLTDLAESNVIFWKQHPSFQPYIMSGQLDLACFDPLQDQEIRLVCSGKTLSKKDFVNPQVIIANYFIDSLANDVFSVYNGAFCEQLVSLEIQNRQYAIDDPEILRSLEISFHPHLITTNYYSFPDYNRILHSYQHIPNGSTILFPVNAMDSLRNLINISSQQTMLISADKGNYRIENLHTFGEPEISLHGSAISMMVNYHALAEYFKLHGGRVLQAKHREEGLVFSVFFTKSSEPAFTSTQFTFDQAFEACSPDDFFVLKKSIQQNYELMSLEQLLAFLRISLYDPQILRDMAPFLIEQIKNASEIQQECLYEAVCRGRDLFYPIGEPIDLYLLLARIYIHLFRYTEALTCLQASRSFFGVNAEVEEIITTIPPECRPAEFQLDDGSIFSKDKDI